jgi:hypothetical protein
MSVIVFSLARMTGDPLDVLLPMEAGEGERERVAHHWGWIDHSMSSTLSFWAKP